MAEALKRCKYERERRERGGIAVMSGDCSYLSRGWISCYQLRKWIARQNVQMQISKDHELEYQ